MGSYTFKWEHPAEECYVTGGFDDWTKSVKLDKEGDVFQKTVELKDASKKIYYKFVVDNNWVINESCPKEADHEGNVNNFLTPEDITQSTSAVPTGPGAAIINTVTPTSTTAKMAGEQPIETKRDEAETPNAADVPGGFPGTPAEEKTLGINPMPAAPGAVNPVKLEPGQKVPETIAAQNLNEHVKLDKESYEKSDALPGIPSGSTELPPVTGTMTPESSLPLKDDTSSAAINTVGPGATTAALAGQVPLESQAPTIPKEHLDPKDAPVDPKDAEPAAIVEKAQVEDELKDKVPKAPTTAEGTAGKGTDKAEAEDKANGNAGTMAAVGAAAATTGGAIAAAALAAKDNVAENPTLNNAATTATDAANKNLPDSVKEKLPESAQEYLKAGEGADVAEKAAPGVPAEVQKSMTEANQGPEAASSAVAVDEKKQVETELLKEVKEVPAADQSKAAAAKATATKAPAIDPTTTNPAAVKGSSANAAATSAAAPKPEAGIATGATKPAGDSTSAAKSAAVKATEPKAADVKATEPKPVAAKPVETSTAAAGLASTTPAPANGSGSKATDVPANGSGSTSKPTDTASTGTGDKKKHNRLSSIFSKIKHKISDKN